MIVVSNEDKSWAFSPSENLVLVSESNQFKAQLNEQPELRDIIEFGEKLEERGVETTQAETVGSETINGRESYKVEANYDGADLEGVTVTYYIDKESSLPQRVVINMERDQVKISALMELNGEINTDGSIDSAQFTFNPPDGAIVFDLSELPPLPDFSNSDIFKNE
jgi:outer membrane lipoprotein-sorting protein